VAEVEIERKFLVTGDAWRDDVTQTLSLRQGYLPSDGEHTVRVRLEDDTGVITIKGRRSGAVREHSEATIPAEIAEQMLDRFCARPLIEKRRHLIPAADGLKWEIDEFLGENAGLVLAEIELPDETATFERPEWLGADVTDDGRYYNARLAREPYTEWSTDSGPPGSR
jgi:adenylate cyclase